MTYTRRPGHWATDTAGRRAFEAEVRRALIADGEFEILDSTDSYDEVDFELGCRGRRIFLEAKEKKQRYREAWVEAAGLPEEHLFILDELAARKVVLRSPRAYVLINDHVAGNLHVFGALEIVCIPKRRVNRSIDGGKATYKGKWLIDLRHAEPAADLADALAFVKRRASSEEEIWRSLACHGRYEGETVKRL